jgi:GT2 family glycosyltransferase
MIDIFVTTTTHRPEMTNKSLSSLFENTDKSLYRLTVVVDGVQDQKDIPSKCFDADYLLVNKQNIGLGPSVNHALAHIVTLNNYFDNKKSRFVNYVQDDVEYTKGWLEKLVKVYDLFSRTQKLGFVSGHNAPEHDTTGEIKFGKDT